MRKLSTQEKALLGMLAFVLSVCAFALGSITGSVLVGFAALIGLPLALGVMIALGLLFLLAVVAVHEAGHFFAARLVGIELIVLHLTFWEWVTIDGKTRRRKHSGIQTVGGSVMPIWRTEPVSLRSYIIFVAGGPLASLLVGSAALSAYLAVVGPKFDLWELSYGEFVWSLFAGLNLYMFVGNLLPFKNKDGTVSDGLNIWNALRYPNRTRCQLGLTRVTSLAYAGVRSRDLDLNALLGAEEYAESAAEQGLLQFLKYCIHWDRGEREIAYRELVVAQDDVSELAPFMRDIVVCCSVYAGGLLGEDIESALAQLAEVKDSPQLKHVYKRARAVAAAVEGDVQGHAHFIDGYREVVLKELAADESEGWKAELENLDEIAALKPAQRAGSDSVVLQT